MANSWTPGPWKDKGKDGKFLDAGAWDVQYERAGSFHWVPIKAGKTPIAIVMARGYPENSNVGSNARLIAHAPEMAEALEALLDNGHSYESEGQCRDAARALLSRIRGETEGL